ncbi:MAG: NAD(P)H-hydrate dehydratase [Acidobacteriota bacterium]
MIPVLDNESMRRCDRTTIEDLGVPSLVLMERAAVAVTDAVFERFGAVERVVVASGPGNNGGDGLAIARQLACRGVSVEVALLAEPARLSSDASRQLGMARAFRVPVHDCSAEGLGRLEALLAGSDLVVDAMFGTGLERALSGRWADAVAAIVASGRPVVAVDVPSGLNGSSAATPGPVVDATLTVTFSAPKLAHVLPPACWRCGDVAVGDIGIPPWVLEANAVLGMSTDEDVTGWLPSRAIDAHKGSFGHLLIVAGRVGRAGAAALAARAAVTSGAGLVTVATAEGAVSAIQATVLEAMVDPLPQGSDGAMTGEGVEALLARATALAVGPGIGLGEGPRRLVGRILEAWHGPLLLDADALTLLAGEPERIASRRGPTLLTPHPGELARLLSVDTKEVAADRLAAGQRAAQRSGATVLVKGARTLIVSGGSTPLVNPTGSPGLASGGAGDVLAGVCGGLLAQGLGAQEAAAAGSWLHGRAAELAGERFRGAVPASTVAEFLAGAEAELRDTE